MSKIATLRFITDQSGFHTFRGSNAREDELIHRIKDGFEPYLYNSVAETPEEVINSLWPLVVELMGTDTQFEEYFAMYEPQVTGG